MTDNTTATATKSHTNHVTLFSNGMGHFVRYYTVPAGKQEKVSIPFKRDDMDQVLASLAVFGNVKYNSPPSFTPTNSNATSLVIDRSDAGRSLLRALSGAKVIVRTYAGTRDIAAQLLGVETVDSVVGNETVSRDFVVIEENGTIQAIPRSEIRGVEFTQESVQAEINKALQNNFQKIKPDSSFLDLSLSGVNPGGSPRDETATIQYAVPVAAWKMRYSIRQVGANFLLEGAAIIDNNSDEDWDNFIISVVTGNPISFSTDLAAVTVPRRNFVQLVDDQTLGNVNVEHDTRSIGFAARAPKGLAMRSAAAQYSNSFSNNADFGLEAACAAGAPEYDEMDDAQAAAAPGVDAKEIGDFCVFTSKEPISIASKRSAVVPMFTVTLTTAGFVLLYKEEDHTRRPFRAVKFKNETDYSLGKGKVVIYQDGLFAGESVLQAAKPGENRMLPHCLENGVKIVKTLKKRDERQSALRFSKGIAYKENVKRGVTEYEVENKKDETFKVLIEHNTVLKGDQIPTFSGVELSEVEKLPKGGYRLCFTLQPKQSLVLRVQERLVTESSINITNNYRWIDTVVIQGKHPLVEDAHIKKLVEIQTAIDEVSDSIRKLDTQKNDLLARSERIGKMIMNTQDQASLKRKEEWLEDLDSTEKAIRKIEDSVRPSLLEVHKNHQFQMELEIKKLNASWRTNSVDDDCDDSVMPDSTLE